MDIDAELDSYGRTPLMIASINGQFSTCVSIVSRTREARTMTVHHLIGMQDAESMTALEHAAARGHERVLNFLLACEEMKVVCKEPLLVCFPPYIFKRYNRSLELAAGNGHIECTTALLACHEKVGPVSAIGMLEAYRAASKCHPVVAQAVMSFLTSETSPETFGYGLDYASRQGYIPCVSILLRQCSLDMVLPEDDDDEMATALCEASAEGHADVVRMMLGEITVAECETRGRAVVEALTAAARQGHRNCVLEILSKFGDEFVSGSIAKIDGKNGDTPLFVAASGGQLEVVKILAKLSDRDQLDRALTAAVHGAIDSTSEYEELMCRKCIDHLLFHGAMLYKMDEDEDEGVFKESIEYIRPIVQSFVCMSSIPDMLQQVVNDSIVNFVNTVSF